MHRQDYLKKMESKKQARIEAGLVCDRFPKVSGIVIHMTYFHKAENPVLMERTVNIFPTSHAFFNMECMIRGCNNGGFDLTDIIARQIRDHKTISRGRMACHGKEGDISTDHASIAYQINIRYNKSSS